MRLVTFVAAVTTTSGRRRRGDRRCHGGGRRAWSGPRRGARRRPVGDVASAAPGAPGSTSQMPCRPGPAAPEVLAIGLNYAKHVAESAMDAPAHQLWFNKQSTCMIGPGAPIDVPPRLGRRLRGRAGLRHRPALPARAGRARRRGDRRLHDLQRRERAGLADAHAHDDDRQVLRHPRPLGPWVVTPTSWATPRRSAAHVGERRAAPGRQDRRSDLRLLRQVEHLSTAFTLEPGDVISTGTPAGVGIAMKPPVLLRPATSCASRSKASAPSRTR